jgi:uncharacterized membrane protein
VSCEQMGEMMGGMMGQMGNMMGGGMMWVGLLALLVIAIVGLAVVMAIARRPAVTSGEDPNDILRRRFAHGELSAEEYAAARETLRQR